MRFNQMLSFNPNRGCTEGTRINIRLVRMSQAVYFRLLPKASCVANLGHERLHIASRSLNGLAHRTRALTRQPAKRAPQRAFRVRGLRNREFRSCVRRAVGTNVAAPDRMRGTAAYERVRECLVYPSLASDGRTKSIIHFLGGAFIGAAPNVIYRFVNAELLERSPYNSANILQPDLRRQSSRSGLAQLRRSTTNLHQTRGSIQLQIQLDEMDTKLERCYEECKLVADGSGQGFAAAADEHDLHLSQHSHGVDIL